MNEQASNQLSEENNKPIKSPCISVCALDMDDVCLGCFRTMDEITGWTLMENPERRDVLEKAQRRAKERGSVL